MRIGITLPLDGEPLSTLAGVLDEAAAFGYSDVWTSEIASADAFTPLTMTAVTHPRFRLGTAIASAFVRSPALLAMTAASLAEISAQEVLVGIGASSDVMVTGWHGIAFEHPYRRVRDTLRFLRVALTGEKVRFHSDSFDISGFRLGIVPPNPPRLLIAALREQMLALAGREADGAILNCLGPADVPQVTRIVLEHNADAEIVARIFVVIARDREVARAHARRLVTAYLNVPAYAEFHRWLGRAAIFEPMWRAWAAGDRTGAIAAVPDALVDELFLTGTSAEILAGVESYRAAGVSTPVLSIMTPSPDSTRAALRFVGAVSPAIGGAAA
ncbi:MAG TPA: LLM class F420-dependent oxidoreductase [Streptosporangiaceae bacterium]|nr:LLM class F420-dependent oxidoreductase [Streptosporangiaceae bacterium]